MSASRRAAGPRSSGRERGRRRPPVLAGLATVAVLSLVLWAGCSPNGAGTSPGTAPDPTGPMAGTSSSVTATDPPVPTTPPTTVTPDSGATPEEGRPLGPARVYTDPDYGFTFAYPEAWKLTVVAGAEPGPGGSSLKDVGAFDPTGSGAGGVLLDGVAVSVFRLSVVVTDDLMPAFEAEVEDVLTGLRGRLSGVEVEEPLRPTTVNGIPGFETEHTFTYERRRMRARIVFLAAGGFEYQLTAQAAESSWQVLEPSLDLMVESFSPTG